MYQVYNRGAFIFYPGFFQLVVFKGLPIPCGGGADSLFLLLFLQFVSLNLNFFFVFCFLVSCSSVSLFHRVCMSCLSYQVRSWHCIAVSNWYCASCLLTWQPISICGAALVRHNLYIFYVRRIGTDTGCARCRRVERTVWCQEHHTKCFDIFRPCLSV